MAPLASTKPRHYTYRPVDSINEEIRLVTIKAGSEPEPIQCILAHGSLRDSPRYEALSYVWGDSRNREEIFLDDFDFSVTRNLAQALRYLRSAEEDRIMWIDAICINQGDIVERSAQVQLMRRIYHDAQQVVSWIEDENVQAADAAEFISEAKQHQFSRDWAQEKLLAGGEDRRRFLYVVWMISRDCQYWSRTWITQEVALAQKGVVQCRDIVIPYDDFRSFSQMFSGTFYTGNPMLPTFGISDYIMLKDFAKDAATSEIVMGTAPGKDLLALLRENRFKRATDPRDKVYGLLGLAAVDVASHDGLKIDYSDRCTMRDVYIGAVRAIVDTTSKLDIICDSCPSSDIRSLEYNGRNPEMRLPSWTPDWSNGQSARFTSLNDPRVGAAGCTPMCAGFLCNGSILSAAGICVGTIGERGRLVPSKTIERTPESIKDATITIHDWYKLVRDLDDGSFGSINLFSRTILLGHDGYQKLNSMLLADVNETLNAKEFTTHDHPMLELVATAMLRNFPGHQFFIINPTKNDPSAKLHDLPLMGLGPRDVQEDDMVCVFLGCSNPVVIRPDGDRFKLISAVYVDNLMDGQAMDDLDDGFYDLMTFEMH